MSSSNPGKPKQVRKKRKVSRKKVKSQVLATAEAPPEEDAEAQNFALSLIQSPTSGLDSYLFTERMSPDWRSREIEKLLNERARTPHLCRTLSPLSRRYYLFRQTYARYQEKISDSQAADRAIAQVDPVCFAAYRVYDSHNAGMRNVLEARILSGQSSEEISELTTIPIDVIDLYSELYFDVRPRLHARDWICNEVLGAVFQGGDAQWQPALTAKYFAYFGGPLVLDAVLYGNNMATGRCESPDDVNTWVDLATRFRLRIQSLVAITNYRPSRFDVTDLMAGYVALSSFELREKDLGGEDNVLSKVLDAVKMQNPVLLGDKQKFTEDAAGVYAKKGVVPRVHERVALAKGHVPESLQKYSDPGFERVLNGERARQPNKLRDERKD